MPVAERRQQRGSNVIILTGIISQAIIGSFKFDEENKLNSATITILWTRLPLNGTCSSFAVSKISVYLCTTVILLI